MRNNLLDEIRKKVEELYDLYEKSHKILPNKIEGEPPIVLNGREIALAKTKLEESVMWVERAINQ